MQALEISTDFLGKNLSNPTILASGILGMNSASLLNAASGGAGAVTTKSISLNPREGHPSPIIQTFEGGIINAVGLSNPGADNYLSEITEFRQRCILHKYNSPIIASIVGFSVEEFIETAKKISSAEPDFIELNLSCPNVQEQHGKPFATDPDKSAEVVREIKKNTKISVITKLSPNVADIKEIAKAVEKAGADAISAINTVGPGMVIDLKTAKPILANKTGGVSGPVIKPIAVRCVYEIYQSVKCPIIGIGGITTGKDAVEIMMAGASAVGIGSGIYYRGTDIFKKISVEIEEFMKKNNYSSIKELVGLAHENR